MKPSRKRSSSTPTDAESLSIPVPTDGDEQADEAAPAADDPSPSPPPVEDRPISERQRRRLIAEQEALQATENPTPEPAPAELSVAQGGPLTQTETLSSSLTLPRRPRAKTGDHAYRIAGAASLAWIAALAAWLIYETGQSGAALDPLRLAVYALIAAAPVTLALMLAHMARQGAGLAAETRRARELAEAMLTPTALAAQQTGEVLQTLRGDIDQATLAAERARNDMVLLRQALVEETQRLGEAAETAAVSARRLADQLGAEHERLNALGARLDTQASGVLDAVERQSRMVVDASDLAQTQLREAEAGLSARAADLAAAAAEAQGAARLAADDLSRQTLRLENAGTGVAEQIQSVEAGLGQQRAALVSAAYALRTDQEDFSAQVESQRAQLTEQLEVTRLAASQLSDASGQAGRSVQDLIDAAHDQLKALIDIAHREADGFDNATKVALDKFETLAAEARDALVEETRSALEALQATADRVRAASGAAVQEAQHRADRLGEILFETAQKADQAADARVESARKVVADTSGLIDEAGQQAAERLEVTVERVNATLARIQESIRDLDARTAKMPDEAQRRIEAVRASVEGGLSALSAASQKAAADTAVLEADFQERIRRNYEMLTEAVRLMGVVSGDAPQPRRRDGAASPTTERATDDAARPPLRGRLQLEPDEATKPARSGGGGWRELVRRSIPSTAEPDEAGPAIDLDDLSQRVVESVRRMGVDPNALLPRARVDEAALALTQQEPDQARQIVRRVAPAAVRSVSRRVLTEAELRADAETFVRLFGRDLAALAQGGDGWQVAERLSTDAGRAFMLLDAAIGDIA